MHTRITSSTRKDESSKELKRGEYVKCILPGEIKERIGTVYDFRKLQGTVIVWIDNAGGFWEIPVENIREI